MTSLPLQTVNSARPTPVWALLDPRRVPRLAWRHRELIGQLTLREIQAANRDTALGLVWVVLGPMVMLGIYTLVFGLFLLRSDEPWRYALWLYCGLTLFQVFTEPMGRGPGLVAGRPNLVKRVVFPLEVLPITGVGVTLFYACVSLLLLVVAKAIVIRSFSGWELLFPLAVVPAAALGLGVCTVFAAIGVFVRDLRNIINGPVSRALFFLTPLVYPLDRVPERFRWVVELNPLTPIVEFGRACLIDGQVPEARWWVGLASVTAMGVLGSVVGFAVFTKAKRGFADVI